MGQIIQVASSNVTELDQALESLRRNRTKLTELTRAYPLECQFAGYRFVFETGDEIDSLIATLDSKLRAYRSPIVASF